ncbi:hypothetical protein SAMN05216480_12135 [Pustulibacterium marinum]|uniref:DUF3299 domain-containing protein n=1 Tax=Pustulibacterium marinum TaxID=1224947 RepID=A0A1I7IT66_9FLAO|nr:hypothetical protein [Pustulibacterium marinum]SFU76133.1 hypothetical protein SAMN05216480_12135 [Pustulibacterium marinum]
MKHCKIIFIIYFLVCGFASSYAQQKVTWTDLSKVTFTEEYFQSYGDYFLKPHFKESVKKLAGKTITVEGHFLNIFPEENVYILSKTPMSACFFCGVGGPETTVELQFNQTPSFKTDAIVSVTGTLELNSDGVEHFIFILKNCKAEKVN